MPLFTVEEINFMSYFDTSSRHALIRDMEDTPLSAMDEEMSEMLFRMVMMTFKGDRPTPEEFILQIAMMMDQGNGMLQ